MKSHEFSACGWGFRAEASGLPGLKEAEKSSLATGKQTLSVSPCGLWHLSLHHAPHELALHTRSFRSQPFAQRQVLSRFRPSSRCTAFAKCKSSRILLLPHSGHLHSIGASFGAFLGLEPGDFSSSGSSEQAKTPKAKSEARQMGSCRAGRIESQGHNLGAGKRNLRVKDI